MFRFATGQSGEDFLGLGDRTAGTGSQRAFENKVTESDVGRAHPHGFEERQGAGGWALLVPADHLTQRREPGVVSGSRKMGDEFARELQGCARIVGYNPAK